MSGAQKKKLQQLQETLATRGNEVVLQQILIKTKWDVNQAVDHVFSNNISLDQGSHGSGSAASGSSNYNQ